MLKLIRTAKKAFYTLTLFIPFLISIQANAQISGLSGWNIYLDPGHSKTENMGIYNYSEAEKVLRIGLALREMLLTETDIDTAYICRTNDQQLVDLSQRTDQANSLAAAWYHSIHSNAGSSTTNNVLLLWGEDYWKNEKVPTGGKAMSDIMVELLSEGMRIPKHSSGSIGDCSFYSPWHPSPCTPSRPGPWLHVNRATNMRSELSEGGHHTNPEQNQLNMNADWKRLEARTLFWSILDLHGIERPVTRILTGIVSDLESDLPINGAWITTEDRTYITDTYESLFYKYSTDSTELRNGFYYFEDLDSLADSAQIIVEADGYYSDTVSVLFVDDFFTFKDIKLISKVPPFITSTYPEQNDSSFSVLENIEINFSRPMNTASVESTLVIEPEISGRIVWKNGNKQLLIIPDSLRFSTEYQITIDSFATDLYGHKFDGNKDGIAGDPYVFSFLTGHDIYPPVLKKYYPSMNLRNVERRPIIRLEYDELLQEQTVTSDVIKLERYSNKVNVNGTFKINTVNKKNIVHFFPEEELFPQELYVLRIFPGIKDLLDNETTNAYGITFNTGDFDFEVTIIDNFENGVANWWKPNVSGSTTGIKPGTIMQSDAANTNLLTSSTVSMKLHYEWDLSANTWLIREYLGGGAPYNVKFDKEYIMQAYVFGDGSNTRFRIAVDDKVPNSAAANHEVSPWFIIDWNGWKLLSWDMANDGTGEWLGDGNLDGTLRFDSFQLSYAEGAADTGSIFLDDLRVVKKIPATSIEKDNKVNIPQSYYLAQNNPNPFNPTTQIQFGIPTSSAVKIDLYNSLGQHIKSVFDGFLHAGFHKVNLDLSEFPSGFYIYSMRAGSFQQSKKMLLVK